ncbi:hypothetical protein V6N12_042046 [Hibiscus sabdariffa]|uniref:Uncharacterized protein n=1 Tax=Hibiscus sabdariffa TaxID=183260 RepID=A0ABR2EF70_9ROSI
MLLLIEGAVLAVKKALVIVSYRLQDCPSVNKTRVSENRSIEPVQVFNQILYVDLLRPIEVVSQDPLHRPIGVLPRESFHRHIEVVLHEDVLDLQVDHLSRHCSMVPSITLGSTGFATGVHILSLKSEQEVVFEILCLNDRCNC